MQYGLKNHTKPNRCLPRFCDVKKIKDSQAESFIFGVIKDMTVNTIPEVPFPTVGALTAKQLMSRLNISKSGLARLILTKKIVPLNAFRRNRLFAVSEILKFLDDKRK